LRSVAFGLLVSLWCSYINPVDEVGWFYFKRLTDTKQRINTWREVTVLNTINCFTVNACHFGEFVLG